MVRQTETETEQGLRERRAGPREKRIKLSLLRIRFNFALTRKLNQRASEGAHGSGFRITRVIRSIPNLDLTNRMRRSLTFPVKALNT